MDNVPQFVIGDPIRLNQILINLIGNAIKFTPHGEVVLRLETTAERGNHCTIRFSVKDTGIGISDEKQSTIFEEFHQVDNSTTRKYGGTGLGLSISKKLIELMGGELSLKSEFNKGSEFFFTLPYEITNEENTEHDSSDEKIIVEGIETKRILLADDNRINRLLATDAFNTYNDKIQLDVVNDGLEAINAVSEKEYDVILMDLQMPNMNGLDATRYIRTELKSDVVIIALTASILPSRMNECISVGMDDFVLKPFSINHLMSKIAQHLHLKVIKSDQSIVTNALNKEKSTLINLDRVVSFCSSTESVKKSIESLIKEIPEDLDALSAGVRNKEWERVSKTAHSLMNKSFYTGSKEFIQLVKELEENARKNADNQTVSISLDPVLSIWENVKKELEDYMVELKYKASDVS